MRQQVEENGAGRDPRGGRGTDPHDGHAGPGGGALPHGHLRTDRPLHPRARGPVPPLGDGGQGHEASPSRVRQPLVRAAGLGQHRSHHGAWRIHGAGSAARGIAPRAQDGSRCVACRVGGSRRGRRGPRRHGVPQRAVLGEPRPEGQERRTERAGGAAGRDPGATAGRRDRSNARR
jgi:hypothetical protein